MTPTKAQTDLCINLHFLVMHDALYLLYSEILLGYGLG